MSEVQKKRKNFMFFGKKNVSIDVPAEDPLPSPEIPPVNNAKSQQQIMFRNPPPDAAIAAAVTNSPRSQAPVMLRAKQVTTKDRMSMLSKRGSMGALEDLVQCPVCLEKLYNPKMLPCQHTFCYHCLEAHIISNLLDCPSCHTPYPITSPRFLDSLPSNLYIDNLLKLLQAPGSPGDRPVSYAVDRMTVGQKRCTKCQSIMEISDENSCNHCKQVFCGVCWSAHISDLKSQISSLLKQLETGNSRLTLRLTDYRDRHESLVNKINSSVAKKIEDIMLEKDKLLAEANKILENGETAASSLENQLKTAQDNVKHCISSNFDAVTNDGDKVAMFMNYHRMTIDVLNEVSHFGDNRYVFDQENFKIEDDNDLVEAEADDPVAVEVRGINNPLENSEVLTIYYRSRNFTPRMSWKKCQRPAGVSMAPWDSDNIYICTMDAQHILVIEKHKGKVMQRITDPNMLCPHSIAFSPGREEMYVTDKWNHCVHVISKEGVYMRSIGSKGNKDGFFRSPEGVAVDDTENFLYVCDTGNDRVQVFNLDTGAFVRLIGIVNKPQNSVGVRITQLNAPTGIAIINDKVIIADSGNRKIKTYSLIGEKLHEFGSFGSQKGQFRHPEAVAVDPLGFILVGDSGNARIQIFKPNGALVRVFGGRGKNADQFGWISGIHITPQLEIVVSDPRTHLVSIF